MSAYYLKSIRIIQPKGPYYIAGFSFGATIAFEIGRQLEAINESVAFIGLFEGWAYYPKTMKESAWFKEVLQEQYDALKTQLSQIGLQKENPWFNIQLGRGDLHEQYTFRPIQSPLTLFKCQVILPAFKSINHPSNYWDGLSLSNVKVIACPGDHMTMLNQDKVEFLAEALKVNP